jgi:hypothetical protein
MNLYNSILKERNSCFLYKIDRNKQENPDGWIGGNPPSIFNHNWENELNGHKFYLTFLLPFKNRQISIFIPEYEIYVYHNIYPDCSIKVFEHDIFLEEQEESMFKSTCLNQRYFCKYKYCTEEESKNESFLIKFGGKPILIQEKIFYYDKLKEDGFDFLIQIDENGYPIDDADFIKSYPFSYGALYLYAKIKNEITSIIAGYWQST